MRIHDKIADMIYLGTTSLEQWLYEHDMVDGKWRRLYYWSYGAESRYNCAIDPNLKKRIKEENRINRWSGFFYYQKRPYRLLKRYAPRLFEHLHAAHLVRYDNRQRRLYPEVYAAQDASLTRLLNKHRNKD